MLHILFFLFIAFTALSTKADYGFGPRKMTGIPVMDNNGDLLAAPFLGGKFNSLHQLVDIDGDGDLDLFLQTEFDQTLFFENMGNREKPDFQWNESFGTGLNMGGWFYFADIDADGDYDLVGAPNGAILMTKINTGGKNAPKFSDLRGPLISDKNIPLEINLNEDMDFADIDCDGDLDLFAATTLGTIRFFENSGSRKDGLPLFKESIEAYQGLKFSPTIKPLAKLSAIGRVAKVMHGSLNTLTWVDIDNDGDQDLVYGDYFDPSMSLTLNTGSCKEPKYANAIALAEPGIINTGGGNLARFADLNGDGTLDLIISNLQGARSVEYGQKSELLYFKNTAKAPQIKFALVTPDLLPNIDAGAASTTQFVDIDGDGDQDFFIINKIDTGAEPRSGLFFYRNIGEKKIPSFKFEAQKFLSLGKQFCVTLAFGDLDGDGDQDLLTGNFYGTLAYFKNQGSSKEPSYILLDSNYSNIDVGQKSAPALTDIDGDGDLDLLIGEARGIIKYFRNEGTAESPDFVLQENTYQSITGFIGPSIAIGDVNGDGLLDLVKGGDTLASQIWINSGSKANAHFTTPINFETPLSFTPALVDIDGDGDLDLFGGCQAGGMAYYDNTGTVPYLLPNAIFKKEKKIEYKAGFMFPHSEVNLIQGQWRILMPYEKRYDLKGVRIPNGFYK